MIDEKLKQEITEIAAEIGCTLFSMDFAGGVFKIILDKLEGGVTIDDCTSVSRQVSPLLDVSDFASKKYSLVVSSPGLDRPLRDLQDYIRFSGSLAKITWHPDPDSSRTEIGTLLKYDRKTDLIQLQPNTGKIRELSIPFTSIVKANLEIDI